MELFHHAARPCIVRLKGDKLMRKWWIFILALSLMALWTAAPAAAQDDAPPLDLPTVCRDAATGMAALTADLAWPDHLMQENAVKTADDFDVNAYFTVLDHLAVEDGYFLDYVYQYDFMGGFPVLYMLPDDQPPFETFADYSASLASTERTRSRSYLDHIVTDDTPAGYLQMAVLDIMGGQFYLHWHAGYNDFQVVCDRAMLDTLLASDGDFGIPIPEDVHEQARQLDVTPTVEPDENAARVELVGFTKWGGFYRVTFTMSRATPRDVYDTAAENLVPYNCGVAF
jgi:hypothetical protein